MTCFIVVYTLNVLVICFAVIYSNPNILWERENKNGQQTMDNNRYEQWLRTTLPNTTCLVVSDFLLKLHWCVQKLYALSALPCFLSETFRWLKRPDLLTKDWTLCPASHGQLQWTPSQLTSLAFMFFSSSSPSSLISSSCCLSSSLSTSSTFLQEEKMAHHSDMTKNSTRLQKKLKIKGWEGSLPERLKKDECFQKYD